ncbi:MAG: GNAT family N-acetyltransferase [Bacteroidota bacterium]|nr:GNAT family N-acetyltransferase [Bacteroidota bacterium]MDP4205538.1 GNAT family N-acetyltransferase [Bacteroidota bacterium]
MGNGLTFGNVKLRALEPADVELLYQWENNPEIWKVSNTLAPFSKYTLNGYIQNSHRDIYESRQLRLIVENQEGKAVGCIDLFDFEPFHARAGVGILIYATEDRRNGYASDALKAMIRYCRNYLRLHQIYANVGAKNIPSLKLFEKAGFERTGLKKEWQHTSEGWEDELIFQLIL